MARKRRKTRLARKSSKKAAKERHRREVVVWNRRNQQLTVRQRLIREKSLEALSLVRRERLSLRDAANRVGLDPETVRLNTNAFRKAHGRWKAKKSDSIPRTLVIYEKGRVIIVEVADSRIASLIGEYHNGVKQFLETGKSSFLRELPRKRFRDIKRRSHTLETNPKSVLKIKAREAKPEFFEIYRR